MSPPTHIEIISNAGGVSFPDDWYHMSRVDHFWFEWRFLASLTQALDLGLSTDEPLSVLEIGCGSGVLREQFESATRWRIDGTDLCLAALQAAKPGRGRTLFYNVLEEREGFIGAYDVVILFDVLEHIDDTKRFLSSALRHLKPGGHLLVNVPALNALRSPYDDAAGHLRRYDRASLIGEFAATDLQVRDVRYWGLALLPLLFARRIWLGGKTPDGDTIRKGFEPPGRVSHLILRLLRRVETSLWSRPFLGASLLLAGTRGRPIP